MSEMVHIGEGSCSLERRGGAGRTCTVVPKIRKAVLKALAGSEWHSTVWVHIREANSERIRTQRSTEIRRKNLGSQRKADLQQDAPTARVRRRPPTQEVPCRQSPVYCDRRNKWLSI
jgi:hypothetical protein